MHAALRPLVMPIALIAALVGAWTWPPSANFLRSRSENNLGYLYLHGIVVDRNPGVAIMWYTRAAERGFALAEYNLGYIYQTGDGVAPNAMEAARWYEQAAVQDYAEAANNLAMMYTDGSLGRRDLPRARAWLKRAGAAASGQFAPVVAENLAALEQDMSAEAIVRSDALLESLPRRR